MTRVLALADQSKIGCITQRRFAKVGTKTHPQRGAALDRNGLSVSTETACRFEPKSPVGNSEICTLHAQAQKADGAAAGAQAGISPTPVEPIERVISLINPMLRGWVNYFAVGNSSECFTYIRDWVEKKVRRQLAHARKRKGFGWERWSRPWLYDTLGLFNSYRVRHDGPKVAPV